MWQRGKFQVCLLVYTVLSIIIQNIYIHFQKMMCVNPITTNIFRFRYVYEKSNVYYTRLKVIASTMYLHGLVLHHLSTYSSISFKFPQKSQKRLLNIHEQTENTFSSRLFPASILVIIRCKADIKILWCFIGRFLQPPTEYLLWFQ